MGVDRAGHLMAEPRTLRMITASRPYDSLAESDPCVDIFQAFEEDLLRSRLSPVSHIRGSQLPRGQQRKERKVSPRESVGSEGSLSLAIQDRFSFPEHFGSAEAQGLTHDLRPLDHESHHAFSDAASRGLYRAHSAQEIRRPCSSYYSSMQDIPHIQVKQEDLDLAGDCPELDSLLFDSIHLTSDGSGQLSMPHASTGLPQGQHITTKDEFAGWPMAGVPAPGFPTVCPSQSSQASMEQALSHPRASPPDEIPAIPAPPLITAANLTRGRGWNRRRSLQAAFDMAAGPPEPDGPAVLHWALP
ncbi:hypothetical protein WJX84_012212 [Apatococcus fuscideae]|uniref:Uncharacterized protein n=1 Tax=Apatococcus fuscideae TaxID=2026836 RepID=A0AAW1SVE7_9CHLO